MIDFFNSTHNILKQLSINMASTGREPPNIAGVIFTNVSPKGVSVQILHFWTKAFGFWEVEIWVKWAVTNKPWLLDV